VALSQTPHPLLAKARSGLLPCALLVAAIVPVPRGPSLTTLRSFQCGAPASVPSSAPKTAPRRAIIIGTYAGQIEEIAIWDRSATCAGDAVAYDPESRRGLYCSDGHWNIVNDYAATAFVVAGDYLRQSLVTVTPALGDSAPEWARARPLSARARSASARSTP
jgi:hypothetical protein